MLLDCGVPLSRQPLPAGRALMVRSAGNSALQALIFTLEAAGSTTAACRPAVSTITSAISRDGMPSRTENCTAVSSWPLALVAVRTAWKSSTICVTMPLMRQAWPSASVLRFSPSGRAVSMAHCEMAPSVLTQVIDIAEFRA